MKQAILWLARWSQEKAEIHRVNPWIFAILYFGTWPTYVWGIAKFFLSLKGALVQILFWLAVAITSFLLPYLYIIFWGSNLSRRFYYILGGWILVAASVAVYKVILRL